MSKEIKNLREASDRILKAIADKERIILYGDSDMDGVTSVVIMKEAIRNLSGSITDIYFPDRETEGYGITPTAIETLKKYSPALFVAMDCGIGNFSEIKLAKEYGFSTVIIDHHQVLEKLPEADIIVDPKQEADKSTFKDYSAAGLVLKVVRVMLEEKMTERISRNFFELVALSTIADMMPRLGENKIFIEEGLRFIEDSPRPGIKAFFDLAQIKEIVHLNERISKMISILNIRDVKNFLPASYRLLTAKNTKEAKVIVLELLEKSKARKETIERVTLEIEHRLSKSKDPIIFEGGESFDLILISSTASILCNKYKKPVFIYKKMKDESHGTVRTQPGVNSVDIMKKCSKNLLSYGGHAQASGFRLKNENLDEFKACLIKNYKQ